MSKNGQLFSMKTQMREEAPFAFWRALKLSVTSMSPIRRDHCVRSVAGQKSSFRAGLSSE